MKTLLTVLCLTTLFGSFAARAEDSTERKLLLSTGVALVCGTSSNYANAGDSLNIKLANLAPMNGLVLSKPTMGHDAYDYTICVSASFHH